MRTTPSRNGTPGYVSIVLVLSTAVMLTLLMVFAYRSALHSQTVQSGMQLRADYGEKEEEILRSLVAITPNRAIRAMQNGSNADDAARAPLQWRNIFSEAFTLANARTSISQQVLDSLGVQNPHLANTGDGSALTAANVGASVKNLHGSVNVEHIVTSGLNFDSATLGAGFPPALDCSASQVTAGDLLYPIISNSKIHGTYATGRVGLPVADYPRFNLLEYPRIGFGYAKPGEPFVAKRNWWAFSLAAAANEAAVSGAVVNPRQFTLSIYEIPSQLAISAESFMSLGQHASGESWQNTNIKGGVFAGSAVVQENTAFDSLASRRGMNLAVTATVGGQSFNGSPFAPGVRDNYLLTQGEFFPVSRASESGRAAFVPISRGELFFDRFAVDQNNTPLSAETNMLSDTGWNHYSMGSLQAAMRLDVVAVESETNATPAKLRFSYLMPDGTRAESYETLSGVPTNLPAGYVRIKNQNERHQFPVGAVVDVAYGTDGGFAFLYDVSGEVAFDNQTFGNPKPGVAKYGYWRPRAPFRIKPGGGRTCVALYPERLPAFLSALKAAGPAVNHSVVVNVDYSITGLNDPRRKPSIPSTNLDYGVILQECANLTPFTKGFSLVTNFRLYMGDDFNVVEATPPVGYTPAGRYFPPCSLFAPERRYGVEEDPFEIKLSGQVGSLAKGHKINIGDGDIAVVRPLESRGVSNEELKAGRIVVNLRPITHPVELPPITMMNWLVVLEERRKEFFGGK